MDHHQQGVCLAIVTWRTTVGTMRVVYAQWVRWRTLDRCRLVARGFNGAGREEGAVGVRRRHLQYLRYGQHHKQRTCLTRRTRTRRARRASRRRRRRRRRVRALAVSVDQMKVMTRRGRAGPPRSQDCRRVSLCLAGPSS